MSNSNRKKTVLVIGGHDPSGGAGIQADIEAITEAGCRAVSVITALTRQNTRTVVDTLPQKPKDLQHQLQCLLEDMPVAACKIGMIGNAALVPVIETSLRGLEIPIVLDPVLRSGSGAELADSQVIDAMLALLVSQATVVTPNSNEARQLSGCDKLEDAASALLANAARSVLITGTHEKTEDVKNQLYLDSGDTYQYQWPRLPHSYHGSGCTLASRIAAHLALESSIVSAVELAQDYTWHTLQHAEQAGHGQWLPNRFYTSGH